MTKWLWRKRLRHNEEPAHQYEAGLLEVPGLMQVRTRCGKAYHQKAMLINVREILTYCPECKKLEEIGE